MMHRSSRSPPSASSLAPADPLDLSLSGSQLSVSRRPGGGGVAAGKAFARSVSVAADGKGKRNTLSDASLGGPRSIKNLRRSNSTTQVNQQANISLSEEPRDDFRRALCPVGWIFTDLISEDTRIGTVRYSRNQDSYYLSAEECITSGYFQNLHSNPCRLSRDGHFGSKFVTVVATGGPDNQVHFESYQVSNQCMALDKDKFGNDVTFLARPLPVEYLIIDITTTFPKDPQFTFSSTERFPIENRDVLGETQDFHSLSTYLSQSSSTSFLNIVSDFHLLLFLVTNEVMPLRDSIGLILEAVKTSNEDLAQTWKKSEQWATIEQLCSTVGAQPPSSLDYGAVGGPSAAASSSSSAAMWSCLHCTFVNQPGTELCEMCSLPRG
ncbi:unnamed protein product [Arctogadus glacialis]